jgi:hypothetical protein
MSSSAIVALVQASVASLGVMVLSGLSPVSARAESAQFQSAGAVQAAPAAESPNDAAAATSASTVLKTPTAAPEAFGAIGAISVQPQNDDIESPSPAQRRTYQRAASVFSSFCHDWERLLHDREVNNLEHLSWRSDGGLEVATYTGYGKVQSCECKASKEGLPIGKIRYEEILYSIAGKTVDEARHAAPKLMHEINTLEIFSWDKGKWFY